ncbi:hypothetical protein MUP77_07305 [Candidatus Bathyarchaeota archaeon]|nr:hypothetical protein [Candidatus Bathyarchaeota archaeon]
MRSKLQLVRDDEMVLEIPLSTADWSKKQLVDELATFEEDSERLSRILATLSSETRALNVSMKC